MNKASILPLQGPAKRGYASGVRKEQPISSA